MIRSRGDWGRTQSKRDVLLSWNHSSCLPGPSGKPSRTDYPSNTLRGRHGDRRTVLQETSRLPQWQWLLISTIAREKGIGTMAPGSYLGKVSKRVQKFWVCTWLSLWQLISVGITVLRRVTLYVNLFYFILLHKTVAISTSLKKKAIFSEMLVYDFEIIFHIWTRIFYFFFL